MRDSLDQDRFDGFMPHSCIAAIGAQAGQFWITIPIRSQRPAVTEAKEFDSISFLYCRKWIK